MTQTLTMPTRPNPTLFPSFEGQWRVLDRTGKGAAGSSVATITALGAGSFRLQISGTTPIAATLYEEPALRQLAGATDEPEPRSVMVALWSRVRQDRLVIACDGVHQVIAAERQTRRSVGWTVEGFLLRPRGFKVVAEKASGRRNNPKRSHVSFAKVAGLGVDSGLYDIFADGAPEAYDRLLYNPGCGSLSSIYGWRQVALQPSAKTPSLFAMFFESQIIQAGGQLMPFETTALAFDEDADVLSGDDVGVWGAEEG